MENEKESKESFQFCSKLNEGVADRLIRSDSFAMFNLILSDLKWIHYDGNLSTKNFSSFVFSSSISA